MKRYLLLTAGRDRPGIVAEVTKILYENGCNIEDSSMTRIEDEFVIMLIFTGNLNKDAFSCLSNDLLVDLKELPRRQKVKKYPSKFILSFYGGDRPGIVYKISEKLKNMNINISDLKTKRTEGENPIYLMTMEAEAGENITEELLKRELSSLAQELNIELSVRSIEEVNF